MFSSVSKVRPNTREFQCNNFPTNVKTFGLNLKKIGKNYKKTEKMAEKCAFGQNYRIFNKTSKYHINYYNAGI